MSEPKKVFLIDDEEDLCITVKAQLENNGFIAETAIDGEIGIQKIKEFKPDIIILDLMMPVMDGFDVCEQLQAEKETKDIPIIILSAINQEEATTKVLMAGADGYVVKPFEEEELMSALNEFL